MLIQKFTTYLDRAGQTAMYFIIGKAKETILKHIMKHIMEKKIKNGTTEVTLKLWSNVAGDSKDENNFLHKLLLTNTQVSKFGKLLQMVYQLIWKYQKLNRIKQGNQEDFKVDL